MKIADNIIRRHLRNVLFITGGAFGGKTTMAKLLAEKHGFKRYREGDMWEQHRERKGHVSTFDKRGLTDGAEWWNGGILTFPK